LTDENIFHRQLTDDERATAIRNSSSSSSSRKNNVRNTDIMTNSPTGRPIIALRNHILPFLFTDYIKLLT